MEEMKDSLYGEEKEKYVSDSYVETFWKNYESRLSRYRQYVENREDSYLNAITETRKFSDEFRKNLEGVFKDALKVNKDIVKRISTLPKEEVKENELQNQSENQQLESMVAAEDDEVRKELQNVYQKVEEISLAPWKYTFQFIDRLERGVESNMKEYIQFRRESRKGWSGVVDEYIKLTRTQHLNLARRVEDGVRALSGNRV